MKTNEGMRLRLANYEKLYKSDHLNQNALAMLDIFESNKEHMYHARSALQALLATGYWLPHESYQGKPKPTYHNKAISDLLAVGLIKFVCKTRVDGLKVIQSHWAHKDSSLVKAKQEDLFKLR